MSQGHQAASATGACVADAAATGVAMAGITKSFGSVVACDGVDLSLRPGRIHGILGENGAGKSTLMKILCGLYVPDAGSIAIAGSLCQLQGPNQARQLGIAMVHQHFSLVPALKVWENVVLGDTGPLRERQARRKISEISRHYGLDVNPDDKVEALPVGVRQRVEIIKCLVHDPAIVILDEPTSVLSQAESESLFGVLRQVVGEESRCVALVSHKLNEVLAATDDITIMRQGKVVAQLDTAAASAAELAEAMVGRRVNLPLVLPELPSDVAGGASEVASGQAREAAGGQARKNPVLRIRDATAHDANGARLLDSLSFDVYPGEITAIAGVEGNGQSAIDQLLSSLLPLTSGSVEVDGKPVRAGKPGAFERAGVAVISEDRHDCGCVMDMTLAENLFLADPGRAGRGGGEGEAGRGWGGWLQPKAMAAQATQAIEEFNITAAGPQALMWSLSGGNQQRVVLARALAANPKVLLASQPTRGLDVGAVEYFLDRLREAARAEVAVLFVSHELSEILHIADRILVLYGGRIIGEMSGTDVDMRQLGLLMGGVSESGEPAP